MTLVCSLLSLPLFFVLVRRWFGTHAGLVGLLFLCVCPWHVMLSRWGLECNPLPFFLLLGLFSFERAVRSRSAWWIVPSLLPFALALYAYGIAVVFVPLLLAFLACMAWPEIAKRRGAWIAAMAVGLTVSFPILLFVFKNYVTKRNYGFEQRLPFSIPLLPVTRLSEVRAGGSVLRHNLSFLAHGMQDYAPWNQAPHLYPLPLVVLGLAMVGVVYEATRIVRERRIREPFLPWLLAAGPILLLVPVKINEAICLFLPLLALAGLGFMVLLADLHTRTARRIVAGMCAALLLASTIQFAAVYFGPAYAARQRANLSSRSAGRPGSCGKSRLRRRTGLYHGEHPAELCAGAVLPASGSTGIPGFGSDLGSPGLRSIPVQPRVACGAAPAVRVSGRKERCGSLRGACDHNDSRRVSCRGVPLACLRRERDGPRATLPARTAIRQPQSLVSSGPMAAP